MSVQRSVRLMLLSTLCFAFMNAIIKELSYLPVFQVVFLRSVFNSGLSAWELKRKNLSLWGNQPLLLIFRGLSGFIAFSLFVYTLQNMPLSSAVTLHNLSPIFTTLIALFFLNERFPYYRFIFYFIAFGGVFLIKGFDDSISVGLLGIALLSSFFSGVSYNLVRGLKESDAPERVVFYFVSIATLCSIPFALKDWHDLQPRDLLWVLAMAILTHIAQHAMTKAYHLSEASVVSILSYMGIVYASLLGMLLFHEYLSWQNALGMLMIFIGILANIFIR